MGNLLRIVVSNKIKLSQGPPTHQTPSGEGNRLPSLVAIYDCDFRVAPRLNNSRTK